MYKNVIDQKAFAEYVNNTQVPFAAYRYPTNKEEYWNVVDKYWSYLLDIVLRFGPEYIIYNEETKKLADVITSLKETHSTELVEYFNKTWASAPDTGYIHAIPAWHILCDLCSESIVLYED